VEHWFEVYELFHGPLRIGVVRGDGGACGFPSFWAGLIEYDPELWTTAAETVHVAEYLALSREAARLSDAGQNTTAINNRVRAQYMDVVESGDWRLVDSHGRSIPIFCPMQHQNDVVSWVRVDGKEWSSPAEPDAAHGPGQLH
jgi:hypothetical protein